MKNIEQQNIESKKVENNWFLNAKTVFFVCLVMWVIWCSKDNWPIKNIWKRIYLFFSKI